LLTKRGLSIPKPVGAFKQYLLSRRIAAIRLRHAADGRPAELGEFLQLSPGVRVDCCGDGYNERTVKVRCAGKYYVVFLQDLYDAESDHL
jgi:hypothetical protein